MSLRLAATIGLLAGLVPALAHAETNIDKGKSPGQIFAQDCAACHKGVRGLAKGKNRSALTDFLREHYTTSGDQAAALAAYVLRGGGGEGEKPAERGRADEPKQGKQGRSGTKPGTTVSGAKLQRQKSEEAKHEEAKHEDHAVRRERGHEKRSAAGRRRKEHEAAPHEPVAHEQAAHEPAAPEPAAHEPAATPADVVAAPAAAPAPPETSHAEVRPAPSAAAPGETAPAQTDNIPD